MLIAARPSGFAVQPRNCCLTFETRLPVLNLQVGKAFETGADLVLLHPSGLTPAKGAVEALHQAHLVNARAVLGGVVCSIDDPRYVLDGGPYWAGPQHGWFKRECVDVMTDSEEAATHTVDSLSAAACLIPRAVWEATGGFDHRFGTHLADVDWCIRARRAGFECRLVPGARFLVPDAHWNRTEATEAERLRSTLLLAAKHGVPHTLPGMVSRLVKAQLREALDRVEFDADFGSDLSEPRRALWFARNLLDALRQEKLRTSLRDTALATRNAWRSRRDAT